MVTGGARNLTRTVPAAHPVGEYGPRPVGRQGRFSSLRCGDSTLPHSVVDDRRSTDRARTGEPRHVRLNHPGRWRQRQGVIRARTMSNPTPRGGSRSTLDERAAPSRITVLRYPTRAYQSDHASEPTRSSPPENSAGPQRRRPATTVPGAASPCILDKATSISVREIRPIPTRTSRSQT